MDTVVLKWILLGVMALVTMVFGLAPIKVMALLADGKSQVLSHRASLFISLISCFAGGVFLGVCFLDMMPDSLEAWDNVKAKKGLSMDYPVVPLIFCCGFFFVYIFEELSGRLCGHVHNEEEKDLKNDDCGRQRAATFHSIVNKEIAVVELGRPKENKMVNSLTFVIAFLFHVGLEGFAFGVQDTLGEISTLFIGIIIHKAVVCFSIGMRLVKEHPDKRWFVLLLISIIALTAFLGGVIGIVVEDSARDSLAKDVLTAVLMSIALGTFIYITFFEILAPEHSNKHDNITQWMATFVGFALIAGVMTISS